MREVTTNMKHITTIIKNVEETKVFLSAKYFRIKSNHHLNKIFIKQNIFACHIM